MSTEERPKPFLAGGNPELDVSRSAREREWRELVSANKCFETEIETLKPNWCVWGNDFHGGRKVLFWIRRSERDEWVARKIAKYLNNSNSAAGAVVEMTAYSENYKGNPAYQNNPPQTNDLNDGPHVWHG
ncbi:MAG: hypothetical protein AAB869_01505 [Patescibacteria group bacterium]